MKFLKSGDEYVEKKMNQFFNESGMLLAFLLLLDVIVRGIILDREPSEYVVSGIGFGLYACWIIFRYLFSGLEYPDIASKQTYRKKRKEMMAVSITSGFIFLFLTIAFTGIPGHAKEWLDLVMMVFLFVLFYFLINVISLRMSFKKNKDLLDD